ncbi:hypothetical protein MOF8_26965 [Methylobacterium oryzae]
MASAGLASAPFACARSACVPGAAFDRFLAERITPRFPEGLTVFAGRGQWRGPDGRIVHEAARIVLIVTEPTPEAVAALHWRVVAVEVRQGAVGAAIVNEGREVGEVDRQLLRQPDRALALADQLLQPILGPVRQHHVGEAERIVDAHAAVAEIALRGGEQRAVRRVVQVDRVLVREHELDEAEGVALPRGLTQRDVAAAADHLVAAPGLAAVAGELRRHRLQDRGRDVPGRVDDRVFHRAREQGRARFRLADDDPRLVAHDAAPIGAEAVFRHVDQDVIRAQVARQPAPPLHVDDEFGLPAGRARRAAGIRQSQHRLDVQDAVAREPAAALELRHRVRDDRIVLLRLTGAFVHRGGRTALEVEMRPQQRDAGVAHTDAKGRSGREAQRLHGRRRGTAQGGEPILQREIARRRRIVGLKRLAGHRAGLVELRQHVVPGRKIEMRGDQPRDRGEIDPAAASVPGVEHRRSGQAQIGIGDRLLLRLIGERRHRVGARVETVLGGGRQPRRDRLRGVGPRAAGNPQRPEGAGFVEAPDRVAILAGQAQQEGRGIGEPGEDRCAERIRRGDRGSGRGGRCRLGRRRLRLVIGKGGCGRSRRACLRRWGRRRGGRRCGNIDGRLVKRDRLGTEGAGRGQCAAEEGGQRDEAGARDAHRDLPGCGGGTARSDCDYPRKRGFQQPQLSRIEVWSCR